MSNHPVVIRVSKLKTRQNVAASLDHTHRLRETKNADPEREKLNNYDSSKAETLEKLDSRLAMQKKVRKNAVLCLEYVVSAHQDWFNSDEGVAFGEEYLKKAQKWLEQKHGAENIIGAAVHRDEQAPHLVVYAVPIDKKGKLNAREFTGDREKLSQMQTDFAHNVGREFGLCRGVMGSKARHTTVKQYYSAINKPSGAEITPEDLKKKTFKRDGFLGKLGFKKEENEGEIAARLNRKTAPTRAAAAFSRQNEQRTKEMARTAENANERAADAERKLRNLAPILELQALEPSIFEHLMKTAAARNEATKKREEEAKAKAEADQRQRRIEAAERQKQAEAAARLAPKPRPKRERESDGPDFSM